MAVTFFSACDRLASL